MCDTTAFRRRRVETRREFSGSVHCNVRCRARRGDPIPLKTLLRLRASICRAPVLAKVVGSEASCLASSNRNADCLNRLVPDQLQQRRATPFG